LVKGWEAERKAKERAPSGSLDGGIDSDNRETEDDGGVAVADESSGADVAEETEEVAETPPPSKSTRSKTKGKGKK
jgi:hypothetical protein|tara:strand:+ start:7599 stop:7826 length:228 start_codon:yes stop_codon:yes gene_type:complete